LLVSVTWFVVPRVLVPVIAQTAIRLSRPALKSSADRKYSVPAWLSWYVPPDGVVAGWIV
jgi:hypothetical protein